MLSRTIFFTFLFVFNCSSSLLVPLAKQDGVTMTNTNNLLVKTNQIKEMSPNKPRVTEVIQQIDVKDNEHQVISNINQVVLTDEVNEMIPSTIQNNDKGTLHNAAGNLVPHGNTVLKETNSLNISLPLLSTNSVNSTSGNTTKVDNATVPAPQNKLENESRSKVLNTTDNVKVNNASNIAIKEVSTVLNDSMSNGNVNSSLVRNNKLTPVDNGGSGRNVKSLNNSTTSNFETSNDDKAEISWRSDIPMKRRNKDKIAKLDSESTSQRNGNLNTNNRNGSVNNNISVANTLKNSTSIEDQKSNKNDKGEDVFVIINTGNMDGLSVNSANNGNLQVNAENNTIQNLNPNNSKFISDLVNTTINNVISNILQQNHTILNTKHNIFLILNSGNITNVHVNSLNLENNITLKDRSRRHLNDSNTNKTKTLQPFNDKSYPIIDIKFRSGENQSQEINVDKDKHISTEPLNNNQSNSIPKIEANDNATHSNSKVEENTIKDKDIITSAEAPEFRSLIPDKRKKLQNVSNVVIGETNNNKNNNLVLKKKQESPQIFGFNPMGNILSGAFDFMSRFRRNTEVVGQTNLPKKSNCKTKQMDDQTVKSYKKINKIVIPTRKSLDDNGPNVLKVYDSIELVCPLSVIIELYAHQVLDKLAKNRSGDEIIDKIVSSLVNGDKDEVDLASIELYNIPFPVALRLQIDHGKMEEFIEQLSSIVDATLCTLG